MKKTFALIMALALTITCLVGCGSKDAGSEAGGATTQNAYERIMANGYMTVGIDPTIENIIFTEAGFIGFGIFIKALYLSACYCIFSGYQKQKNRKS